MAGLLWVDNSYGNIPPDFSRAGVNLKVNSLEVFIGLW